MRTNEEKRIVLYLAVTQHEYSHSTLHNMAESLPRGAVWQVLAHGAGQRWSLDAGSADLSVGVLRQ